MSYCNVWAEVVFLWFSKKGDVYTNFTMPTLSMSPKKPISLLCVSIQCRRLITKSTQRGEDLICYRQ